MPTKILDDRRIALEEAFFARQNEAALRRMIEADAAQHRHEALASATGMTDDTKLALIERLGIGAETLAALTLAPLVLVAWADGSVSTAERAEVRRFGRLAGLPEGGAGMVQLEAWLDTPPNRLLQEAWAAYAGALGSRMAPEARETLAHHVLEDARAVAAISGGLLGIAGRISPSELAMLDQLSAAFQR
jgi:hypothetical protein